MPNSNYIFSSILATGRGLVLYDSPVPLEPAIRADARSHSLQSPDDRLIDDGRYPGLLERLLPGRRSDVVSIGTPPGLFTPTQCSMASPQGSLSSAMTELQVALPQTSVVTPELSERLLLSLANHSVPVSVEIIATGDCIQVQFAVRTSDAEHAERQISAHFRESVVTRSTGNLDRMLQLPGAGSVLCPVIIDFGLRRGVLYPLNIPRSFDPDPLIGLVSGLSALRQSEVCVFQVLFQTVRGDWKERLVSELTDDRGQPRFRESKELLALAKQKLSRPLLATAARLCMIAPNRERAVQIGRGCSGIFRTLAIPNGNELIALPESSIPAHDRLQSVITRTTHRSGMLLNSSELSAIAHLPSASVESEKLGRKNYRTKKGPPLPQKPILTLGHNLHDGRSVPIGISAEQFTRHLFVAGGSGGGKSVFICNSVRQIAESGSGCAVIDPAGDLVDDIAAALPESRLDDVVLFDASDAEFPIGFNPLQAETDAEKYLLSSDLVALFKRYSTAWGSLMEAGFGQAINAFLYNSRSGTLLDLKRFLVEKAFRRTILETVEDDTVRYFWEQESGGVNAKSLASVLIRLDGFLRHPLIRNIVCQPTSNLNFREAMDQGKILLIKVSQGLIGQENAALLGSFLISRIYQVALSRQDTNGQNRKPFWIFADEVQNYLTPSLGMILAGTRKYGVGLTLATQSFKILQNHDADLAESILANCFTRVCFRLGDEDAKRFAQGFSYFTAEDLQRLSVGEAIARVERSDVDFNLKTLPPQAVSEDIKTQRYDRVREPSRQFFAQSRDTVEGHIKAGLKTGAKDVQPPITRDASDGDEHPTTNSTQSVDGPVNPISNQGRAGQHHQDIQTVIKRMAETYGFSAAIEESVLDDAGRVDVSLRNDVISVACEVSVSTVDYEVTNVRKCLAAGYSYVAVVVSNRKKIPLIRTKIFAEIGASLEDKVLILTLPDLLTFLRKWGPEDTEKPVLPNKPGGRLNFTKATELLNIGSSTLYRWIREGRVPFYRLGREYQFDRDELLLTGKYDSSGKRKPIVKLPPLSIEKRFPKTKKQQDARYRKLLDLD
jgi:excisionase family DNA binding protein